MRKDFFVVEKFKYGADWCVRCPDGKALNLNTEEAADTILGLWETIEELEQRLHKRESRRARRTKDNGDDGDDEDS